MTKGRRVGTFTSGIMLIAFGTMFLINSLLKIVNYKVLISLWPVILISLGAEIIAAYVVNDGEKIRYDSGAIIIVMVLCAFSMIMGGLQLVITNYPQFRVVF
ncbi:MAG TPA: hypothetical protein DC034_07445 [Clostridium sp.]|jgi:hypothetical protein|uniref:DUF5668 domain-containing protein n=1 Tax=Clostridium lapidicellarium TaxID=3240931 RepID=A0ABV4DWJ4_9CLOT|nr:DUF5668 domain-containing protein [uncultured Clostridium sp.]NLU06647.1 hypothetical protein [Clostridiales bacterium]HBC96612.1 hypothetical protein [Clostridium sp.]